MSILLYSTNTWLKWYINKKWRSDIHFVWCSEFFDPSTLGSSHTGSLLPPTSNPAAIYRDLARAVAGSGDRHNAKIIEPKSSIITRAEDWRRKGDISGEDADEIIEIVNTMDIQIWRPQLYVIPRTSAIESRIVRVPLSGRAGLGDEYQVADLAGDEFDRIELNVG